MPKHTPSPEDQRLAKIFSALAPVHDFPRDAQLYLLTRIAAHIHGHIHHLMQHQHPEEAPPT